MRRTAALQPGTAMPASARAAIVRQGNIFEMQLVRGAGRRPPGPSSGSRPPPAPSTRPRPGRPGSHIFNRDDCLLRVAGGVQMQPGDRDARPTCRSRAPAPRAALPARRPADQDGRRSPVLSDPAANPVPTQEEGSRPPRRRVAPQRGQRVDERASDNLESDRHGVRWRSVNVTGLGNVTGWGTWTGLATVGIQPPWVTGSRLCGRG